MPFISQCFQESDQGSLVGSAQREAAVWMLGEVRIKGGAALDAGAVVLDNFLQGAKAPVVHIRGG